MRTQIPVALPPPCRAVLSSPSGGPCRPPSLLLDRIIVAPRRRHVDGWGRSRRGVPMGPGRDRGPRAWLLWARETSDSKYPSLGPCLCRPVGLSRSIFFPLEIVSMIQGEFCEFQQQIKCIKCKRSPCGDELFPSNFIKSFSRIG